MYAHGVGALLTAQRAIEIVQRAIDEDVKRNYQEAYVQYQNSLDYFMMAMKCASGGGGRG